MAICRFFLQGNCKFGNTCRNEHPNKGPTSASQNPFGPLQGPPSSSANRESRSQPYSMNASNIKVDLLNERPQWILSSYAPGKDAPIQLFGGFPREQSFEEMRVRHYQLAVQGKQQQALEEAQRLFNDAEEQIRTALQDVEGAIRYVLNGENQHPNRIDVCKSQGLAVTQNPNAAGNSQPSAFNQQSDASAFSQASAPFASASSIAPTNRPAFGQSSFGQPSSMNQPANAFGQPSFAMPKPTPTPAFGQQSALRERPQGFQSNLNPIQQASNANITNVPPTQNSTSQSNPFARTSESGSNPPSNPIAPANPFLRNEQPSVPITSQAFGPSQTSGTFGTQDSSSRTQLNARTPQSTSAAQIQKDGQGNLRTWNGKAVTYKEGKAFYRDNNGQSRRIWLPEGAPSLASAESLPDETYNPNIQKAYEFLRAEGVFANGIIPEVAPKKEWCDWNV